jgi:hypothetical protein
MLDERLPTEPPARASAMAGAKERPAQNNSASRMRQFGSGLDIVCHRGKKEWQGYGVRHRRKHHDAGEPSDGDYTPPPGAFKVIVSPTDRLIGVVPPPKYLL